MPQGAFNGGFEPIARPGGFVQFDDVSDGAIYAVRAYNVLPEIQLEENFTPSDGGIEKRELTDIEMDEGFLAQYRLLKLPDQLPDDVEIEIDHDGKQAPLYQTENVRGVLTNETGAVYTDDTGGDSVVDQHLSQFTELFVWEDNPPYFTVKNNTGGAVDIPLTFSGYAYRLEQVATGLNDFDGAGQPVVVPRKSIQF